MELRAPAIFIADSVGLDFLNSTATPVHAPRMDWLDSGQGLLRWLDRAKLVPPDFLDEIKMCANPAEVDKVAQQACALREWFRRFVDKHMGQPLPATALLELGPLNTLLQSDETFGQITYRPGRGEGHFQLRALRHWRSAKSLLLPIGEALARLVCEEDFANVKACEGDDCTLMFADHTRRRTRRWCSMATCGNRAKQATHRNRLRNKRRHTDVSAGEAP